MQESNSYKVIELDPLINNNNPGVIRKDIKNKDGGNYYILRYDKDNMVDDIKKYRSVIFDNNNKLVCYSLPKSIPFNEFVENNNDINDDNVVITEIIEGTMINLFYDSEIDKWQLSSKGSVGCDYFFYRNGYDKKMKKNDQKTFKQMFLEALRTDKLDTITNLLPKEYCYNFVLQHPDNHIVLSVDNPRLYLTTVWLLESNNTVKYIPQTEFMHSVWAKSLYELIYFPKIYEKIDNYDEMNKLYINDNCQLITGLMYINIVTGDRCSIIHSNYKKMKELRGNNPNLQYQYLCLKKINKVKEFLAYFPQYNDQFLNFFNEYKNFLKNLHQSYFNLHIKRNNSIEINKKYLYHVKKLHYEVYLPSLTTEKKIMNKTEVYNYFERYDPIQQLYYLNYNVE
jgi:hypothetical protein